MDHNGDCIKLTTVNTDKKQWLKNFNLVHTFNKQEIEICRQAKIIKSDPRFTGSWEDAIKQAVDILFNDVEFDSDAMRISK